MAAIINKISITIDNVTCNDFHCKIGNTEYYATNFQWEQKQAAPNQLTFHITLCSVLETLDDATFNACALAVGKPIVVKAESETSGLLAIFTGNNANLDGKIAFDGLITKMEAERSATSYSIKVTAQTCDYLLTLGKNCRSFDGMTLKEIVESIINNYNGDVQAVINPSNDQIIPYTVQYKESDYEFLKRLAANYGEWLYHDGDRLVFGNILDKNPATLNFMRGEYADYKVVTRPVNLFQDFIYKNYRDYASSVQGTANQANNTPANVDNHPLLSQIKDNSLNFLHKIKHDLIRVNIGGNSEALFDEIRQQLAVQRQVQQKLVEALRYEGTTYCAKLTIGTLLTIENSFLSQAITGKLNEIVPEDVLLTEVTHYIRNDGAYYNTYMGRPMPLKDKPGYPFIPVPTAETCTAKVVDNEDPELLGRIRVQYDWQETYEDQDMFSPWLRIVHPYAGGGKGFSFIPEIGEEVMVQFVGNSPEKPYVIGTLFNGVDCPDENWLPDNNHKNPIKAIRTRNGHTIEIHDEGEDGYIRIYDNEKENYILTFSTDEKLIKLESTGNIELYAKNDIIMHADHNINASVGNDIFIAADHDMQRTADNDIREHAGNDRSTSIGRNDSLSVESNQFIRVNDNKDEQVAHKLQVTAENIRMEAQDKLLEYSTTHHQKAENDMAINAGSRIDIKAGVVKVN
jgi:phage-related baseplate assembly protein